jgi:Zn-dependent protease
VVDRVVPPSGESPDLAYAYFDRSVIAWGGVVAQAIVAVPLLIWVETLGYTRFQAVNAILTILGLFSLSITVLNLVPIRPLDGAIAWAFSPPSSSACAPNQPDGNPDANLGDKSAGSIPIV